MEAVAGVVGLLLPPVPEPRDLGSQQRHRTKKVIADRTVLRMGTTNMDKWESLALRAFSPESVQCWGLRMLPSALQQRWTLPLLFDSEHGHGAYRSNQTAQVLFFGAAALCFVSHPAVPDAGCWG